MLGLTIHPVPVTAILVVLLLLLTLGLYRRLARIEARQVRIEATLAATAHSRGKESARAANPGSEPMGQQGPFEQFLAEDPGRLAMSKSEQFAAFREWRKKHGMNWSEPSS